jgi:hypothetical protein
MKVLWAKATVWAVCMPVGPVIRATDTALVNEYRVYKAVLGVSVLHALPLALAFVVDLSHPVLVYGSYRYNSFEVSRLAQQGYTLI